MLKGAKHRFFLIFRPYNAFTRFADSLKNPFQRYNNAKL